MTKKILVALVILTLTGGFLVAQAGGYTEDYVKSMQKKPGKERIAAFNAYLKKYPNSSPKFSALANYWIVLDYYQIGDYKETVSRGEKLLKSPMVGQFEGGEKARLNLVIGNAYGVKSGAVFNKDKALKYTNACLAIAKKEGLSDVIKVAQSLKEKLTTPPPPSETPEHKMKRLVFQDESFNEAISFYKTLPQKDKDNIEIKKAYANALLKKGSFSPAANVFESMYKTKKTGGIAIKIAKCYEARAKKNSALYQKAAEYYVQGYVLYSKESKASNAKSAKSYANNMLVGKYKLKQRIDRFNAKYGKKNNQAAKNASQIASLERNIKREKRRIKKKYRKMGMDAPDWEYKKVKSMEKKLQALRSGSSSSSQGDSGLAEKQAIEKEMKKIDAELKALIAKYKKIL